LVSIVALVASASAIDSARPSSVRLRELNCGN